MLKRLYLSTISVICLLIVLITALYTYYRITSNDKEVKIMSANFGIDFSDNEDIILDDVSLETTIFKKFKVFNKTDKDIYYSLIVDKIENNFSEDDLITYSISSTNGGADIAKTIFPIENGALASNITIPKKSTQEYNIQISYKNIDKKSLDKNFKARIKLGTGLQTYNISGVVYDLEGNILNGGRIMLRSYDIASKIKSDGTFTLINVPVGIEQLIVVDKDNNKLVEGSFIIDPGHDNIEINNNQIMASSDKNIALTVNMINERFELNTLGDLKTIYLVANNAILSSTVLTAFENMKTNQVDIEPLLHHHFKDINCSSDVDLIIEDNMVYARKLKNNATCVINYEMDTSDVVFVAVNGTVSDEVKNVNFGDKTSTNVLANPGYHFNKVLCTNGQTASVNKEVLITGEVTRGTTCTIYFDIDEYQVTLKVENGSGETIQKVSYGELTSFSSIPDEGYEFESVICDNKVTATYKNGIVTTSEITENTTCNLKYKSN